MRITLALILVVVMGCRSPEEERELIRKRDEATKERLYQWAVAHLPEGAEDIRPEGKGHPTGWLSFAKTESGRRTRYLVCYEYNSRSGEGIKSITIMP